MSLEGGRGRKGGGRGGEGRGGEGGGREGGREGGMEGGEGGEGGRGEMTVIHILMAPRYLYNNRFTYYQSQYRSSLVSYKV